VDDVGVLQPLLYGCLICEILPAVLDEEPTGCVCDAHDVVPERGSAIPCGRCVAAMPPARTRLSRHGPRAFTARQHAPGTRLRRSGCVASDTWALVITGIRGGREPRPWGLLRRTRFRGIAGPAIIGIRGGGVAGVRARQARPEASSAPEPDEVLTRPAVTSPKASTTAPPPTSTASPPTCR